MTLSRRSSADARVRSRSTYDASVRGVRRLRQGKPKAETEPVRPDERALNALADAVRRARETSGATSAGEPTSEVSQRSSLAEALRPTRYKVRRRGHRRLRNGALVAVAILALLGIGIVSLVSAEHSGSSRQSSVNQGRPRATTSSLAAPPTSSSSTRPQSASTIPTTTQAAAPVTTVPVTVSTRVPTAVTTTIPTIPPGSAPQLSSISPTRGAVGRVVVVHGSNLFSPNGLVLARFGGHPAPTICPTQTFCRVTVPTLPGSPSTVSLTITTELGTSNALAFLYG